MEIKFRPWKKSLSKMMPINSLKSILCTSERLTKDEFDDLIVMQSTGVLDAKGVEIFEGDMLRFLNGFGKQGFYQVFRKEGGLCVNSHSDDFKINSSDIIFYESCSDNQTKQWLNQCVIIGNIYDNCNF